MPRVLVIEDEALLGRVIIDALEDEHYETRWARDGREGLRCLLTWRPDVILLDLMMPVMDGWAFRGAQRDLPPELAEIPIIVVSGARDVRATAEALGAAVALAKPFDLDEVVAAVADLTDPSSARPI